MQLFISDMLLVRPQELYWMLAMASHTQFQFMKVFHYLIPLLETILLEEMLRGDNDFWN